MPVMAPAADAARAVIGPDDPAIRVVIIAIVRVVATTIEEAAMMEMRKAAMVMESAITEAAAVKTTAMPTATAMPATVKASAMEATATMEAAAAMTAAAMAAVNLYQFVGSRLRDRRCARRDQRHRLRALRCG